MGEAKNGPDRRLTTAILCQVVRPKGIKVLSESHMYSRRPHP